MNPTYNLIKLQLEQMNAELVTDTSRQSEYAKFLALENNIHQLYSEFELLARNLATVLGKRDQYNADAAYYRLIMANIQGDPTLMEMWTDLLMTMKLTNPAIEEELRQAAATHITLI